jgi:hypothetical protein
MLYAMLEASDPASCYRVYFTKNEANTKDSTLTNLNPKFPKYLRDNFISLKNFESNRGGLKINFI